MPSWTEWLPDGIIVCIRHLTHEDSTFEHAVLSDCLATSRSTRFFGSSSELDSGLIRHLAEIDYFRDTGFIALVERDGVEHAIGMALFCLSIDGKACECSTHVNANWREKGLEPLLMRHLIDTARERGFYAITSREVVDNAPGAKLARTLGFHRIIDHTDPTHISHVMELRDTHDQE